MTMVAAIASWPPERRRKAAAGILLGVVVLAIAAIGVPAWLAHRHYDRALEDIDKRLVRYERLAAARPELERKLEAVRAMGSRKYFLKANAASLSAAELQERVRQFVEGNGGRTISVQGVPSRDEGRFRQVIVTIQINANAPALRSILAKIESAEPYVTVESLTVRSQVPPGYKPNPGSEPEMFVQLDVSGFMLSP
jgi:general secretion pathway protein M